MQLFYGNLQKQQQSQSRRTRPEILPAKRSWIYRNPKLFQITIITTSLLIFFSKPLYDIFIADPLPPPDLPPSKRLR